MIKAIIFDMDGVLVDAKSWHFEALNRSLSLFGYRISQFEHHQRFDGLPTKEKLQILAKENGLPLSLAPFINEMKQKFLLEIAVELCTENPVHLRSLAHLKRDGYALALASNSIRQSVDELMKRTALDQFLQFTLSNEDVTYPKPDPEIYRLAISNLGLNPSECMVVEDGDYGIAAAKAAGANVMRVGGVHEVNYENLISRIECFNQAHSNDSSDAA